MNKALIIAGGIAVGALLAKQFAPTFEGIDWEKKLAEMPDEAPPKWMFNNITAIRENTDRLVEQLGEQAADGKAKEQAPA
jgi:hypothetical protein